MEPLQSAPYPKPLIYLYRWRLAKHAPVVTDPLQQCWYMPNRFSRQFQFQQSIPDPVENCQEWDILLEKIVFYLFHNSYVQTTK